MNDDPNNKIGKALSITGIACIFFAMLLTAMMLILPECELCPMVEDWLVYIAIACMGCGLAAFLLGEKP